MKASLIYSLALVELAIAAGQPGHGHNVRNLGPRQFSNPVQPTSAVASDGDVSFTRLSVITPPIFTLTGLTQSSLATDTASMPGSETQSGDEGSIPTLTGMPTLSGAPASQTSSVASDSMTASTSASSQGSTAVPSSGGAAMTTSAPSSGSETTATNASGSVTTSNPAVAPTPCVHHAAAGLMAAVGLAMAL